MTSSVEILKSRPRARDAYQHLVRHIRSNRLEKGSMLPTQDELRQSTGFSHNTLSQAMAALVADGLVVRKPHVGTWVADPAAALQKTWTVAVTVDNRSVVGYKPTLQYLIRSYLHGAGCEDRTFVRGPRELREEIGERLSLDDFPGLRQAVEAGQIDAVLSSYPLTGRGVLTCSVSNPLDFGVNIDDLQWQVDATRLLVRKGCRHVGYIEAVDYPESRSPAKQAFRRVARRQRGLDASYFRGHNFIEGGQAAGRHLLGLPARDRPDALVAANDLIGVGLTDVLSGHRRYRPAIAVKTNLQTPVFFSLPVYRYELDVDAVARRAVEMLTARLLDPSTPTEVHQAIPTLVKDEPER